ncbi:hypothetical protein PTSG_01093 [Salpingoeca rosetta]|uniref:Uncharacterized protein n=1 Tax=Salpingoeca rosetta (strain ATCC 50818 / BSB-021) TaxID=946362 RepID=F2U0S8_SALR5|nr:uncharacterized protein PTSG_01093 [Salpingoeca rosetta]EGD80502.1 hypothetical protein PTSG_01093 [Salpingoeca rosetta]|eukprot:XP_004997063.1 hypothetical protein PTSG_01093 [Salpingoeca rosetta]
MSSSAFPVNFEDKDDPWTPREGTTGAVSIGAGSISSDYSHQGTTHGTGEEQLTDAQISALLPPLPEQQDPGLAHLERKLDRLRNPRTSATMSGPRMLKEMERSTQHQQPHPAASTSTEATFNTLRTNDDQARDASSEWDSSDDDNGYADLGDSTAEQASMSTCGWLLWCCTCGCFRQRSKQRPRFLGTGVRRMPKSMDYRPLLASDDEDDEDVIFSSITGTPSSKNVFDAAAHSSPRSHQPPRSVFALSDSDSDTSFTPDATPVL